DLRAQAGDLRLQLIDLVRMFGLVMTAEHHPSAYEQHPETRDGGQQAQQEQHLGFLLAGSRRAAFERPGCNSDQAVRGGRSNGAAYNSTGTRYRGRRSIVIANPMNSENVGANGDDDISPCGAAG